MSDDEIMQSIERRSRQQRASVDRHLRNIGRHDLADDLAAKLRSIDLGVDGALRTWQALSRPQREVLTTMSAGGCKIVRCASTSSYFTKGFPGGYPIKVGRLSTIRNLIARGLLDCEGGAFDPEATLTLSDRARFVLKHGQANTNGG